MPEASGDQTALTEVSAEQFVAIRADLEKLLKTAQKPKESLVNYAVRLAKTTADPKRVTDDDWETLDEQTQMWVNGMIDADEKGGAPTLPLGVKDEVASEDAVASDVETNKEAQARPPVKTKTKTRTEVGTVKVTPEKPSKKNKLTGKAVEKEVAPKKKSKDKKESKEGRGRPSLFGATDVITVKQKAPFRAGTLSAIGFANIRTGATVQKAIAAGVPRRLIRWSNICGYIEIHKKS